MAIVKLTPIWVFSFVPLVSLFFSIILFLFTIVLKCVFECAIAIHPVLFFLLGIFTMSCDRRVAVIDRVIIESYAQTEVIGCFLLVYILTCGVCSSSHGFFSFLESTGYVCSSPQFRILLPVLSSVSCVLY